MKFGDKQLGFPAILYKDTKRNIASLTPETGSIAFATDTNEIGLYTSFGWVGHLYLVAEICIEQCMTLIMTIL